MIADNVVRLLALVVLWLHLLAVLALGALIAMSSDGNAVMGWLLFIGVDFPVSLGLVGLSYLIDGSAWLSPLDASDQYSIWRDINNFWLPALYNGLVGSLWWYWLVRLSGSLLLRCRHYWKNRQS